MQGRYSVATGIFHRIIEPAHRIGQGRETHSLRRWGEILTRQGHFEEARNFLAAAFPVNIGVYGDNENIENLVLVAALEEIRGNLR